MMKYICDPCFSVFSGAVKDIPGTEKPTLDLNCARCRTLIPGGRGHLVGSYPQFPLPVLSGSL